MLQREQNTKYFIKRPTDTRKSYGLVKYIPISRAKKKYLPLTKSELSLLDSINVLFLSKSITDVHAELRLNNFITEQARLLNTASIAVKKTLISDYNQKAFNKFWRLSYEDRELEDKKSAEYDFKRALSAIDPIAFDSDVMQIRKKLKDLPVTKMKRVYARLNEIRAFLGISEKLATNKSEVHSIDFITLPELRRLLSNTANENVKNAIGALFATGLRLSELLGLEKRDYANGFLNVNKQHRRDNKVKTPKRNKTGKVIVIAELKDYLESFLEIEDKPALRNLIHNTIVETSNRVLKRHIHAHDLRHSHAIYLLGKGASLTLIALQLRNRIEVCQKYYAGFAHTDETLIMLKSIAG